MIALFVLLLFLPLHCGTIVRDVGPDLQVGKCPIVELKSVKHFVLFLLCEVQRLCV